MKIGIVTTWFERGAAYVSRIYMELLQKAGHEVFIYARGGENSDSMYSEKWNANNVTRDLKYRDTKVSRSLFFKWIEDNCLDAILFNEQRDLRIVADTKKRYQNLKLGAYVDYYTEKSRKWFDIFDFVICNTQRHMQALEKHPQRFYVKWGTDTNVFVPSEHEKENKVVFFHSVGMSDRKGTDILIRTYIQFKLYEQSKLVIHTQIPIEKVSPYSRQELENVGIQIIQDTVTAPGLYYLGDVYVYPTRLDGLGLTMYEAIACGLPVITTDFPPMNEVVSDQSVGKMVKVKDFYCREDAYYYPLAVCDEVALAEAMQWYIDHSDKLDNIKIKTREYAVNNYNIYDRYLEVSRIFENAVIRHYDSKLAGEINMHYKKKKLSFLNDISRLRVVDKAIKKYLPNYNSSFNN